MDEIAKNHHVVRHWDRLMTQIRLEMSQRGVQAAHTVILLPYAQLMPHARSAWVRGLPACSEIAHFLPRFETTMNWCKSLGAAVEAPDDLKLDAARDSLTAASLLSRAGFPEPQKLLSARLMEAAWSVARVAAAVPVKDRLDWGSKLAAGLFLGLESPVLAHEVALGRIAVAWAASSNYATDVLFQARVELLVILEGWQIEPMAEQLQSRLGKKVLLLSLSPEEELQGSKSFKHIRLHAASDAEDEALRAASCVMQHLLAGRIPVALVAQDRQLTRRVHAMLAGQGVRVIDETGWKLSTTRSAALVMSLLKANAWDASCDEVLDFLKNAPQFDVAGVAAMEQELRRLGGGSWRMGLGSPAFQNDVARQMQSLRDGFKVSRALSQWLQDLRVALERTGMWDGLCSDPAGQQVIEALRLQTGRPAEFTGFPSRMSLGDLQTWVNQTLEALSFSPRDQSQSSQSTSAEVFVLPVSQLLGRPMAAVVFPGCDEVRLPVFPDPGGLWTPAQRLVLGLPGRVQMSSGNRKAWHYALQFPLVDILWRQSERGEKLMPSPLLQALRLQAAFEPAADPSRRRELIPKPCFMPQVRGDRLSPTRLSSSAYEDLRRCPYRFFALQQLRLKEAEEIDTGVDKRDVGIWLHSVLKEFHESLKAQPTISGQARIDLINACANRARLSQGLSEADFLPFAAAWPRLREGYLNWLDQHELEGAQFLHAETWKEMPLGPLLLVGKIDRIDRQRDGSLLVIDYKTESRTLTSERIKSGLEDSQLAFYAALLPDDKLAAAYVNVAERSDGKAASRMHRQEAVVEMRDELLNGILADMQQIAQGSLLKAMGEGKACEFCAARGLCRKDFWELAA